MVVAKRKVGEVAMQVKNDISININEVVTLALLGINESVNLNYILIFHLSELPDKPGPNCKTESHLRSADVWVQGKQQRPLASSTRRDTGI